MSVLKTKEGDVVIDGSVSATSVSATTFSGDGSSLTSVNADKLDSLDSSAFVREVDEKSATCAAGWVTVAQSTSSRYRGTIVVSDTESSDHGYIKIEWMRSYADSNFTVINTGGHSNRIRGVRVLYETSDDTYGVKKIQVYVTTSSVYRVQLIAEPAVYGWGNHPLVTPIVEGIPSGYALHGNEVTDLHTYGFAAEEGILAGGDIKAKGKFIGDGSQLTNTPTNVLGTRTTLFNGSSGTSNDISLSQSWDTFDELIFYMTDDGSNYGLKYEVLVLDMITAATYASGAEFLIASNVYFWIRTGPRTYLSVRTENSIMKKIIGVNY